jgi:Fic family protein
MRRFTYIHELPDWADFRWDDAAVSLALAKVRHKQGWLLGRMEGLGFDLRDEACLSNLTFDVVKSSAIEGEHLDPEAVRSSIARRLGLNIAGLQPSNRDVDAVVEMMLDATQRFKEPLTAERLFGWHSALFPTGRSGIYRITVGAWRTGASGPMQVVSGPMGMETVHFEAPDASRLHAEMESFLRWFESPSKVDPVVRAAISHLWFVTIHPFEDGNGRIARAIANMSLARADASRQRFYSMSSEIERQKKQYYLELESQQKGTSDITPWLLWFLDCLERAIDTAASSLTGVLRKAQLWERVNHKPVNDRQRTIINLMLGDFVGYLNTSKYGKLTKCSGDTALRDIQELLARGILIQNPGKGRSTSYRLNDPEQIPLPA